MVNTRLVIVNCRGFMREMDFLGISMRPVSGSNVAPGIAFKYTSKKSSARRTPEEHDSYVRSSLSD